MEPRSWSIALLVAGCSVMIACACVQVFAGAPASFIAGIFFFLGLLAAMLGAALLRDRRRDRRKQERRDGEH